jgi:hypothetical protein
MKFIFYIVMIVASGLAGWFFYPDIHTGMQAKIDERHKEKEKEKASIRNEVAQDMRLSSNGTSQAGNLLNALKTRPAVDPGATNPNPNPSTPGEIAHTKPPAPPVKPVAVDEIEARYPMPNFKTIEEITKDWTTIPNKAFPRKVKTKVALNFDAAAGKATLEPGSDANAINMRPGTGILTVMRPGDDTTRIDVPLANTDLKETLTALYERYKEYHRKRVVSQREHARTLKERSNGASEEQMKLAGPKPEVRPGGVVPIMLESITALNLKELKASAITQWGNLNFEDIGGTVYWTGTVQCTVENALFGPTQTEAMALMKDNKVVKWLYTGSREEVQ